MTDSQHGRLIVLCGPAGVGKGTVLGRVREQHPEIWLSVSATTRQPRPGEVDGVNYFFMPEQEFLDKEAAGEFLETADVFGLAHYGTPAALKLRNSRRNDWKPQKSSLPRNRNSTKSSSIMLWMRQQMNCGTLSQRNSICNHNNYKDCNMRSNISGAYFYIKEAKYEIKMRIAQHINCTILIMLFNIR